MDEAADAGGRLEGDDGAVGAGELGEERTEDSGDLVGDLGGGVVLVYEAAGFGGREALWELGSDLGDGEAAPAGVSGKDVAVSGCEPLGWIGGDSHGGEVGGCSAGWGPFLGWGLDLTGAPRTSTGFEAALDGAEEGWAVAEEEAVEVGGDDAWGQVAADGGGDSI